MSGSLPDIQALPDGRGLPLDEVGIQGLRYPVLVRDGQGNKRETVATVDMSVSLDQHTRGAHLSRLIEVLHGWRHELSPEGAAMLVGDLRQRLDSPTASVRFAFPYFLERRAPVTGGASFVDYDCGLTATSSHTRSGLVLCAGVPVTSVCPCSKAISDRGAHNQRSRVTIEVRPQEPTGTSLWFDDLVQVAEAAASSPVYGLLKRLDERHVTMAGYDNPVFVEDMTRSVAEALQRDSRIAEYRLRVVSDESIHNHAAYAQLPWTRPAASPTEGTGQ